MALDLRPDRLYDELLPHYGHNVDVVIYGAGENVAIECEDCGEILLDADRPVRS